MREGTRRLSVLAPAKINLVLEILGRRADGYHDLRSIVVPITLHDRIELETTERGIEVTVSAGDLPGENGCLLPSAAENLAGHALRLMQTATGWPGGVRAHIVKNIPLGGGLGGGSADAAAMLNGANALWDAKLSTAQLMELGLTLGSDVPAMVCGRAVCMEGRGETITPIPVAPGTADRWWLVVVNPGFPVATRDAYARHRAFLTGDTKAVSRVRFALEKGEIETAAANLCNSLQVTVFRKYPLLEMISEDLRAAGALGVLLSGSGASLFALARDQGHAEAIGLAVRERTGPWLWSRVVQMLPDGVIGSTRPFGG